MPLALHVLKLVHLTAKLAALAIFCKGRIAQSVIQLAWPAPAPLPTAQHASVDIILMAAHATYVQVIVKHVSSLAGL